MVCYNMYIYDREGICLFYIEWHRPQPIRPGLTALDEQKNLFGVLYQMKILAASMDPKGEAKPLGTPLRIGEGCSFHSFRASNYKLHFFESPSGIKFVLNTDRDIGDLRSQLSYIYESIYVETVVKNPAYTPGAAIDFDLFSSRLNSYIQSLGI